MTTGGLASIRARRWAPLGDLYDDEGLQRPVRWDLYPYTARGAIALCAAYPKVGKSTFASLYGHAKATGGRFLNQELEPGRVVYVAPDESLHAVVRRFRSLGTPRDQVVIATAVDPRVPEIAEQAQDADLVIVDTLPRVAYGIDEENDNAAWVRWFADHDAAMRDSDAAWLFLHHTSKSGGSAGLGIRGASAIFGCVDIAFSLRRPEDLPHSPRRLIRMEGTRFVEAEELIAEFDEAADTYRLIGDARVHAVLDDAEIQQLIETLRCADRPLATADLEELMRAAGFELSRQQVARLLDKLMSIGRVTREGRGVRGNPYRFRFRHSAGAIRAPGRMAETSEQVPTDESAESAERLKVVK